MKIESYNCDECGKPLMQSNIVGWTCKNEDCIINKPYKDD